MKLDLKKIVTNPNNLTIVRIFSTPVIVLLVMFPNKLTLFIAAFIFTIACVTDYFDGYFARTMGLVSNFGKIMDPFADKLLVSSALIMLVARDFVPAWMVCVIIGREFAITSLRILMIENRVDVSASMLGKYKTGFQMMSIGFLLLHYPYFGVRWDMVGTVLFWIALVFSVWSGVEYINKCKNLIDF